jgi:drug/metabolite transporter (DMT)-like permease
MQPQRIIGIVLLVIGAILLFVGYNASESVADQVTETFTGRFTKATMWYLIGGAAAALTGLLLLVVPIRAGKGGA